MSCNYNYLPSIKKDEDYLIDIEKEELALMIKKTYEDDSNDLIYIDNILTFKELFMLLVGIIIIII